MANHSFGAGLALLVLSNVAVQAQPTNCTTIKDDKERLACFDQAAKQPPKASAPKAAEDPIITKARGAVAQSLKDPPSARFDGVVRKTDAVCGFVNARNSYGGYAGRTRFVYVLKTTEIFVEVPITTLTGSNLAEYEASDAALNRFCPGIRSPFIKQ